ncbi:pilus assembly protein, partial [Paraburkholderia sp. SIMBA_049]
MINILVAADDTARLMQIARLVTDSGHYRVTRAHGRPSQIEHRTDGLDSFDILLIDGALTDAAELSAIERICRLHPCLIGILVTA